MCRPVTIFAFRTWSISRKILFGILPLFLMFIAFSVAINNRFQEQEMMEQAQTAAHTYADLIREALLSMMVNNLEVDESFLQRAGVLEQFDSLHILINDLRLRPEALTPKTLHRLGTKLKTLAPHDDLEREVLRTGRPLFLRNGDAFRGIVPFNATEVCQKCHAVPTGYTLGATDIHISLSHISSAAQDNWRRSFYLLLGFSIAAVVVASVLFRRYVSRPAERLVRATAAISSGNLDYELVAGNEGTDSSSKDELAFLSAKFDDMRRSLREKIEQLDEANRTLAERNAEVEQTLARLKQAQEDLVKSERLATTGRMAAQLSHEINNPIHNIQSLLESSLGKVDGKPRELIALALEEVRRMAKLTRQMLDIYRGSVVEMERLPVDVNDLLRNLLKENEKVLHDHNITFSLESMNGNPCVLGSRDKLKQVFLNLILNARDAMPHGGRLTVRVRPGNGMIHVDVEDTGIGIPPENLGKIFDPFFTTKQEVSGVGLGLAVSYGIVQQHNGSITVSSTPGKGTTFRVSLPRYKEQHG